MPTEPHDIGVSMVVERGLARCPRCVAVADYVFVETSQRPSCGLRYEVRCRKCGENYSEDSQPVTNLPAVVEESLRWPPDWLPEPVRDWRGEAVEILTVVAQRGKSEMDALGKQVQSALETTRTLAKAWVNERNERQAARMLDQTGGYAGGG